MSESPTARIRRAYARIAEVDRPEAWILLRPESELLAEAASLEARLAADADAALPLAGLLLAVKDNIDVAGLPTTAAHPEFPAFSQAASGGVAAASATSVQRLVDAGALVLGKTNLDQFATGLVGSRSPFGAVRAAHDPERISGGSSSGSAVVVALGIADAALGTDTAGSGRVPAALNGIVGIKGTKGLVPVDGVVPACRSYDCVTVFAETLELAVAVTRVASGPAPADPLSRAWPADARQAARTAPRIAVPRDADLAPLSEERRALFAAAAATLEAGGAELVELDLTPFLETARILYEGALVAERSAAYGEFLAAHPEAADPSVARIAAGAAGLPAERLVADQERVARARMRTLAALDGIDALLVPTTTEHPTLAEVAAEPIAVNSRLGTYTNFMNLLDMAGVAVPAGRASDGLFGVTLAVRAFEDQVAIDLAARLLAADPAASAPLLAPDGIALAVFGAHLSGQPLNHQLQSIGARLTATVRTAADYRMVALPGALPKPGIVRTPRGEGTALEAEVWTLPAAGLGTFLAALPQPMALGKITLEDGSEVLGFACTDPAGPDISEFGGWRGYLASLAG